MSGEVKPSLYAQSDYESIKRQLKRRVMRLAIPAVLLLIALAFSLYLRNEYLTDYVFIVLGALLIGGYDLYLSPVIAYKRHVFGLLNGRNRVETGHFLGFSEQSILRDKVKCCPFMINVGEKGLAVDERMFYWDDNLKRPPWSTGEIITLTSFDKAVTGWRRGAENSAAGS